MHTKNTNATIIEMKPTPTAAVSALLIIIAIQWTSCDAIDPIEFEALAVAPSSVRQGSSALLTISGENFTPFSVNKGYTYFELLWVHH